MIGDIVWFTPGEYDGLHAGNLKLAAIVVSVNEDETVNLSVFDSQGFLQVRHGVKAVNAITPGEPYYEERVG